LEYLGLHNKPKAEVHPGHKLMGPKEEKGEEHRTRTLPTDVRNESRHKIK